MMKLFYWNDPQIVPIIQQEIQAGGVIVGTSDTVLGLLASLTYEGFLTLNTIKGRERKPYIILIHDADKLSRFVSIRNDSYSNLHIERLIKACWPGPVTLIFKAKSDLPMFLKSAEGTVALRVPSHPWLQKLLTTGEGLFSTSANRAGQPTPQTVKELDEQIKHAVKYAVVDEDYESKEHLVSTILDCTNDKIKVVREGAYPIKELEAIVGISFQKKIG